MGGLLEWYDAHARPLPWREEGVSSWDILLAEIIMQQTRMETGLPYWQRIRQAYPTPEALAADSQENLLKLWQGCGYYARARNLHRLAVQLDGAPLPSTRDELLELPGIGPYTSAAIASIAFGESVACVDGNVRRVLSRLEASHLSDSEAQSLATGKLDVNRPGDWNQAMMELGSQICSPRTPRCSVCPFEGECLAANTPDPTRWPEAKSVKQRRVEAAALVIEGPEGLLLKAREGRTLGGLWGLPFEEGEGAVNRLLAGRDQVEEVGQLRHDFTHKRLEITVFTAAAIDGDALVDPTTVPLATLDRKVLALHRGG